MAKNALQKAWQDAIERRMTGRKVHGLLGKREADGTYTFVVPGRPAFVYVTIRLSSGAQTVVPALNAFGVPHSPNLAVEMVLENSVYVIRGRSARSDLSQLQPTSPSGVPPHDHDQFYKKTEHVSNSDGAPDAGKPVVLGSDGQFDLSLYVTKLVSTALTWLANVTIASIETTGSALRVVRDLASGSTDAPVVIFIQDNAGDDQATLRVQQDGTGDIVQFYDGAIKWVYVTDGGTLYVGDGVSGNANLRFNTPAGASGSMAFRTNDINRWLFQKTP